MTVRHPRLRRLRRWASGGVLLRRLLRELQGLNRAQAQQTQLLARLVEVFAPRPPADLADRELAARTGVDHLDSVEASVALDYVARTHRDTGRTPTDEEILEFLADEATLDLQERLQQRAEAIARLEHGGRR